MVENPEAVMRAVLSCDSDCASCTIDGVDAFERNCSEVALAALDQIATEPTARRRFIELRNMDSREMVTVSKILYANTVAKHTLVHCVDGERFVTKSLLELEQFGSPFIRVHRQWVVNGDHVGCLGWRGEEASVSLDSGDVIPVSRRQLADVLQALDEGTY